MIDISVTIITRNEELNIQRCLDSVKEIAGEVIVVDSCSTDKTVEICEAFGCRIFIREFTGYSSQKQFAVDQAANDWVLSIDADEVVSPQLQNDLKRFTRSNNSGIDMVAGYYIPFLLFYMGTPLNHCGKGRTLRLFNRKAGKFTLVAVHERFEIIGKPGEMKGQILHYSFRDCSHHLEKINYYTSLAAGDNNIKGKRFNKSWVAFKFLFTFCTFYFKKMGILDGCSGFMWSFMAGIYTSFGPDLN